MMDSVMGWFMSMINDFLMSAMQAILEIFGGFINNIFEWIWEVNNKLNFDNLSQYTVSIALAYVIFKAVKQGLDVYVFETEGDAESDPLELLTRTFQSCAVIYCGNYMLQILINISGLMATEVVSKIPHAAKINKDSYKNEFTELLDTFYNGSAFKGKAIGFIFCIICFCMLIATIIFIFHAGKRGAELCLFKILMPLVAVDLLTTNRERWKQFSNELFICIFGYILQVLSFNVFLVLLSQSVDQISVTPNYLFAVMGWLIVVISAPKWISKWMYTSGIGSGAKGGIRNASMMVPHMMK